jgi:regulator of ribonuclease activity A
LQVALPGLLPLGGHAWMSGPTATLACLDDNSLLRELVQQPGEGRILVIDGQASTHRALFGDIQAARAMQNGWRGLLVYGYVRDRLALAELPFPIFALGTVPLRPLKQRIGEVGGTLRFLNLTISPGMWIYADPDGVIVLNHAVSVPSEPLPE